MRNFIKPLVLVGILMAIVVGFSGCKSSKKAAAKKRAADIEYAKKRLQELLDDKTMSLEELDRELAKITNMRLDDPEVDRLVQLVTDKIAGMKAKGENERNLNEVKQRLRDLIANRENKTADQLEQEMNDVLGMGVTDPEIRNLIVELTAKIEKMRKEENAGNMKTKLDSYFNKIAETAKSGNIEATNNKITEVLGLFASGDVPVLIIINKRGTIIDYDKPTTIRNYLNYLKDVKGNPNLTEKIKVNESGKVTELELIKK